MCDPAYDTGTVIPPTDLSQAREANSNIGERRPNADPIPQRSATSSAWRMYGGEAVWRFDMAVTALEIKTCKPFAQGTAFGDVGPYQQLDGTVYFAVNPDHPRNTGIADL